MEPEHVRRGSDPARGGLNHRVGIPRARIGERGAAPTVRVMSRTRTEAGSIELTDRITTPTGELRLSGENLLPLDRERGERLIEELRESGIERMRSRKILGLRLTLVQGRGLAPKAKLDRTRVALGGGRVGIHVARARS